MEGRVKSWLLLTLVPFVLASLLSPVAVSAAAQFDLLDFGPTSFTMGVTTYVWVYVNNTGDQAGTFLPEGYSPNANWHWENQWSSSLASGTAQNFTALLSATPDSNASSGQIMVKIRNNATGEYDDWMNKSATVNTTQNDAGSGKDANNECINETTIAPGKYSGYLDTADRDDWYNFSVVTDQTINITMTPPPSADFDIKLYNPGCIEKKASVNGVGMTDNFTFVADSTGYWKLRVYWFSGSGIYNFTLNVTNNTVRVSGWLSYLDYNLQTQPIKYALVNLTDFDSGGDNDTLATTYTNASGHYTFPPIQNKDTDDDNGPLDLFITVYAENSSVARVVGADEVTVHKFSSSRTDNIPSGNQTIYATVNDDTRGAFNILNATMQGYSYVIQQQNTTPPPQVEVKWYPGYTSSYPPIIDNNSYALFGLISINDASGQQWERNVIVHEYGHYIMYKYYPLGLLPVPLCDLTHWPGKNSSIGCAFSEGWASFFQAAVKNDSKDYNRTGGVIWDYENNTNHLGSPSDEGTIQNILWDIFDSTNDENDTLSLGFMDIWDVFRHYNPMDIYDLWGGWFHCSDCTVTNHGHYAEMKAIYSQHRIDVSNPAIKLLSIDSIIWQVNKIRRFVVSWDFSDPLKVKKAYVIMMSEPSTGWIDVGLNTSYTFYNLSEGNHTFYLKVQLKTGENITLSYNFTVNTSYIPDADALVFAPNGIDAYVNGTLYADILLVNRDPTTVTETLRIVVKDDRGEVVQTDWKRIFLKPKGVQYIPYAYKVPANAQTGIWMVKAEFTEGLKKRPPGYHWFRVNP